MDLTGSAVRDTGRELVGRVSATLFDPETKELRWLQITLDGKQETSLVPAAAVSEYAVGELLVPYSRQQIESAAHLAGSTVTEEQAAALRVHFGFVD